MTAAIGRLRIERRTLRAADIALALWIVVLAAVTAYGAATTTGFVSWSNVKAILTAAEKPMRDVVVGGAGRVMSTLGLMFPHLSDLYSRKTMFSQQKDTSEPGDRRGSLYYPMTDGHETGSYKGRTMSTSAYTRARLSRARYALPIAAGIALAILSRVRS